MRHFSNSSDRNPGRARRLTTCALLVALLTGCYEYLVHAPGLPGVTDHGEVVWSFGWGLVREQPQVNCHDQALAEVTVRDNLAFSLLTVVTLGLVSPKKVEWKCARGEGAAAPFDTTSVAPFDTTVVDTAIVVDTPLVDILDSAEAR